MQNYSDTRRRIEDFCQQRNKYKPDAYEFVTQSVTGQVNRLQKPRHLSALEVLQGMQSDLKEQFGPLAPVVIDEWQIKTASDIGEIVFDLITMNILSASPEDKRSDFDIDFTFFPPRTSTRQASCINMEIPKID